MIFNWRISNDSFQGAAHLDSDIEVLADIDESELEGLLHDPEFLTLDPTLPPEERKKRIEEIRLVPFSLIFRLGKFFYSRKKRVKERIIDVPPLSKEKLQEIDDPLDYLYKYCIIQYVRINIIWMISLFFDSPDRMANYERVFLNTVKKQKAKFKDQNPPESTTKIVHLKRSNTDVGAWTNVGGGRYTQDSKQYHALDSSDEDEDIE